MKRSAIVVLTILAILSIAAPASAATPTFGYLDPATGTLIVSAIIGGFAAFGMFFKKFWFRIKSVFTGDSAGPAGPDSDASTTGRGPDTRSHSD
jgi:hypothetical protein